MGRFSTRSDYGTCTQCVRFTFIGCNIFFSFLSLLGFIIGIWGVVNANTDYGNNSTAGAAILLVSSIISFGLCATGVIGGIFMLRPFLIVYAIILGLIVILEFISAVISFVFADAARGALDNYFTDAIENYRVNESVPDYDGRLNDNVETIQEGLKCCGVDNATDWIRLNSRAVIDNGFVPPNCTCDSNRDDNCVPFVFPGAVNKFVWEDGCLDILEIIVRAYYIIVGVISLIIMLIEILFVIVAICLTITISKAIRKGGVV